MENFLARATLSSGLRQPGRAAASFSNLIRCPRATTTREMATLESAHVPESDLDAAVDGKELQMAGDGKELPTVEPNVIDTVPSDSVNSEKLKSDIVLDPEPSVASPSPPASARSSPGRLSIMPGLTDLSDLILHSPSQIVGTPYVTNSTRFEYPFPDTSSSPASGSPPMTSVFPSPVPSGSSFPAISASPSSSQISSQTLSYPLSSPDAPTYNSAHPKLKASANPPIPPSLAKKRTRWSLNLMGRRKSSSAGSQSSSTSATSDGSSMPTIDGLLAQQQQTNALASLESPRKEGDQ
ncbi:hypothetical protein JR316_0006325 [Psilocybe cubensis]|uniref:Uncharacterized protein n=2 Tax=Psilocybe cubensis TaxID=181762 RepID=A0ACB8H1Z0_PSICU|nr:hypothetical protein JR316_0006325 [Psilocybe cubensis]KAH9481798.1 hypothetical protein JR316_0006325 [Psilocybe cubensis]